MNVMLKNRLSEAPTQAGSPATMHSVKRFFKPACQLVMALGISLSMALAGSKLVESSHLRWSHLSWMMGALLLLAIAYRVINAYGWTLVLNAMGADVRGGEATRVWLVSESRRWLPGSIWSYASRASMAASIGIPIGLSAASMMVELLCCGLTGAALAFENDSYFEPGNKPRIGHTIIAIDPGSTAGSAVYFERVEALIAAMLADPGVRLPGDRRHAARARAAAEGVDIPDPLYRQLQQLAGRA
jgi:hypothetical protein